MNRILKELEAANDYLTALNIVRPQYREDHENIRVHLMVIKNIIEEPKTKATKSKLLLGYPIDKEAKTVSVPHDIDHSKYKEIETECIKQGLQIQLTL